MTGRIGRWLRRTRHACACALAVLVTFCALALPSWADDAADFTKAGTDLKTAVDAFAKGIPVDRVKKADSAPRNALVGTVKDNVKTLIPYEQLNLLDAFAVETTRLKDTLEVIAKDEKKLEILKAVNRVDPKAKDKADKLTAIDKDNGGPLSEAIVALNQILAKIGPTHRINVVGAWYGDVDDIYEEKPKYPWRGGPRFCTATAAIQAFCEGRSACFTVQAGAAPGAGTSTTGAAGDVTSDKMCGYNPVPYAADDTKALIVFYKCLSQGDEAWKVQKEIDWHRIDWGDPRRISAKRYLDDPATTNNTVITPKSTVGDVYVAVMRNNAISEIRCYRGDLGQ